MIHQLAQKTVWITNVPAASITSASFTTASVDLRGWGHCSIYFKLGAIGAAAMIALKVQEADDDSTYTDVPGLVTAGAAGEGRIPQATDDDLLFAFHFPTQGRKRYVDLVATVGAAATWAIAFAVLSRGKEAPNSSAERGVDSALHLP
jgi:hypothetical protein